MIITEFSFINVILHLPIKSSELGTQNKFIEDELFEYTPIVSQPKPYEINMIQNKFSPASLFNDTDLNSVSPNYAPYFSKNKDDDINLNNLNNLNNSDYF